MVVKAKIKVLQEAISNMLTPTFEQAPSLFDMLLSIYRELWWPMSTGSAMIPFITVKQCIANSDFFRVILFSEIKLYSYFQTSALAAQPEDSLTRQT